MSKGLSTLHMSEDLAALVKWFQYHYDDIDESVRTADGDTKRYIMGQRAVYRELLDIATCVSLTDKKQTPNTHTENK